MLSHILIRALHAHAPLRSRLYWSNTHNLQVIYSSFFAALWILPWLLLSGELVAALRVLVGQPSSAAIILVRGVIIKCSKRKMKGKKRQAAFDFL